MLNWNVRRPLLAGSAVRARTPVAIGQAAVVLGVLVICVLGGATIAFLPWWFVLAFLILPLLAVVGYLRPEIAIIGLWILMSGLVPAALTPRLPLGPGLVKGQELALFLLFSLALLKALRAKPLGAYWVWLRPVMFFLGLAGLATAVGMFISNSPYKDVLQDARNMAGWLMVFVLVYLVRTQSQLDRLFTGLISCGALVAIAVIAQFLTGRTFLQDAPVQQLVTLSEGVSDVIRSGAGGGIYIMIFSLLLLLGGVLTKTARWYIALPLMVLLTAGLVVTFGRGLWIAAVIASLLLAYQVQRWEGLVKLVLLGGLSLVLGLAALTAVKPRTVEATIDRALSTTRESLDPDTTLGWRAEETRYALQRIGERPLVGIGFGTPYKPLVRLNGRTVTEQDEYLTRYIHNAYLGLWLKMGIFGLVFAAWLSWGTVSRALNLLASVKTPRSKVQVAAVLCGFLVILMISFTQPEWLTQPGVAFVGLMLGSLICIHRIAHSENAPPATDKPRPVRY